MTDGRSKPRRQGQRRRGGLHSRAQGDALRQVLFGSVDLPLALDRYTLQRYLGGGAVGRVYEAYDQLKEQKVALKVFRDSGPEIEALLKREFRALVDLSHPNLVTFLEASVDPDLCYFTMELVDGIEFTSYTARDAAFPGAGPDLPCDVARLRSALQQLAAGIGTLHHRGVIHRDLKPSNVLVTDSGRLVVLDFGLSRTPHYSSVHTTFSGRPVGTPAYMAPEQLLRGQTGPASDCYSIGVMLYQALVGEIPLIGASAEAITSARVDARAPRPSEVVPSVPADLDALCHGLLNSAPEARLTCDDILERVRVPQKTSSSSASPPPRPVANTPFVGRARELNALRDALDASASRCVAVALGGPAGIGKSTLIKRFLRELDPKRHVVLAAKCYERESLPYKTIDAVLDALVQFLKMLATPEAQRLRPRHLSDLVRMFPSLTQVDAFAQEAQQPTSADDHERKQRAIAALRELLGRISDRATLVLWIDDLQWGDGDSVVLMRQLLCSPHAPACLCIGSVRAETAHLRRLTRRFMRGAGLQSRFLEVRTLKIGRLPSNASQTLARALMANARARAIEQVARESEGNPFLLALLAEHAFESQQKGSGATLEQVVLERIQRLSPPALEALRLVALAAGIVDQLVIATAADLADDRPFHELRTARLINTEGSGDRGRVELYHGRLGASILSQLDAADLEARHGRLARAMIERGSRDHERIAFHLQRAGDRSKAVDHVITGADRACAALAHSRAAQLYTLALRMGVDGERAQVIREARADSLRNCARGYEAAEAYLEAAAHESDDWRCFELRRKAAQEFLFCGHLDRGQDLLDSLMPTVSLSLPRGRARAITELVARRAWLGVRGFDFTRRAEQDIPRSLLARVDTCWLLGQAVVMIDPLVGHTLQSQHVMLALSCGEPRRVVRALVIDAMSAAYSGPPARRRVERLLELARQVNTELDDALSRATLALFGAASAYLMGEPARAVREAEVAEGILRQECAGTSFELATCHLVVLGAYYMLGWWPQFAQRCTQALDEALERGNRYQSVGLRVHTQMARLIEDDVKGARREIQCVRDEWPQDGFHMQHLSIFVGEARVHLYCDEGVAAVEHLEAMWPQLERSMLLHARFVRVEVLLLRARCCALAYAQTRDPRYRRRALRDADSAASLNFLGARGSALLVRASIEAADSEKQAAAATARRAAANYEREHLELFAATGYLLAGRWSADRLVREHATRAERAIRGAGVRNLDPFARLLSGAQL